MNPTQKIRFIEKIPEYTYFDVMDRFSYRPERRYKLIQRLCFWILRKVKAFSQDNTVSYKEIVIDSKSFMERLFRQRNHITKFFGIKTTNLYIGSKDYAELMSQDEIREYFYFNAELGYNREILGLKIHVIPWMEGMIVI